MDDNELANIDDLLKSSDSETEEQEHDPEVFVCNLQFSNIPCLLFQKECTICFGLNPDTFLLCGHCFHDECITEWLKRSKTCPYCRTEFQ